MSVVVARFCCGSGDRVCWVGVAACLLAACSLVVDEDRKQCLTDADCGALSSASTLCVDSWCQPDPRWSCLDRASVSTPQAQETFPVTLRLENILTQTPIPGVEAKLCLGAYDECEQATGESVLSNEQGIVQFAIEPGPVRRPPSGLVLLARPDLVPGMYLISTTLDRGNGTLPLQLLNNIDAARLAEQLGTELDPSLGTVLVSVFDCEHEPAPGVSLILQGPSASGTPFYAVDGLPAATATMTDQSGYAGLLNAPPGTLVVTGQLEGLDALIATVAVTVRAGTITYLRMVPRGI